MKTVGIIYDTSFLMLRDNMDLREAIEEVDLKAAGVVPWLIEIIWFTTKLRDKLRVVEVVPLEVLCEIRRHFDNVEKQQAAKVARKRVAVLVERGAVESVLGGAEGTVPSNSLMGADSRTDKLIVAYAVSMVQQKRWSYAIIATDDGGIMYDAVKVGKGGRGVGYFAKEQWPDVLPLCRTLLKTVGSGWTC
jgi:hypothetical protein